MKRPTVLIVDDAAANRYALEVLLAGRGYRLVTAGAGRQALDLVAEIKPDLVLLDVYMPGMDGYEVCRHIKADPATRLTPVVMITALSGSEDKVRSLEAGADDFMSKPVDRAELLARVTSALRLKDVCDRLDSAEQVIYALAAAVEAKDAHTEAHTERVGLAARQLAERLGLPEEDRGLAYQGGKIHDIGKIGVPDAVLQKRGPLDSAEWALMRQHPAIGENIVRPLRTARGLLPVIRHHHERWDGAGYPDGLQADEIPILARVVAVCDAYDSLMSDRPYRPGRSHDGAVAVLRLGSGRHWDPQLVDLLIGHPPGNGKNASMSA